MNYWKIPGGKTIFFCLHILKSVSFDVVGVGLLLWRNKKVFLCAVHVLLSIGYSCVKVVLWYKNILVVLCVGIIGLGCVDNEWDESKIVKKTVVDHVVMMVVRIFLFLSSTNTF